jgi:membrane protease YdiL (CAAX protease family)
VTPDDDLDKPPPSPRPGASTFTIEGRAAPALFVVGWLASLLGLAVAVAGAFAGSALLVYFVGPGLLSVGSIAAAGNQAFERRARGAPYAGPSPILVFAATVAVTYFMGALLGVVLDAIVASTAARVWPPAGQLIAGTLTALVFIGVIRLTVVGTRALSWAEMGIRRLDRRAVIDILAGASLALPVIGITLIVGAILVAIFGVVNPSPLPPTGEFSGLLLQLVVGAIIAPIGEEILFRGFAVTAWRRSIGVNRAILRATLLFALAHVVSIEASTFGQAVGLIAVGAGTRLPVAWVLGWLFVRRGSIWASIGLHATFNGVLLILAHLAQVATRTSLA